MGDHLTVKLDANEIYPGLWQGSIPPQGSALAKLGFQGLVLCAKEHQPAPVRFTDIQVIHAPNDDDFSRLPTREELEIALQSAKRVVAMLSEGQKVLVTCRMGKNRSGLVSALTLHLLTRQSGSVCIQRVQSRRKGALRNPGFNYCLANLQPLPKPERMARASRFNRKEPI
jgi:protein tyrosine/serine phosphatase